MEFIHLHNHSDYSILDGALTIDSMIDSAVELGMPGIALTDHGNMFGAIEFYQKARKKGVKPIIGQEFYVAPGSRFDKEARAGVKDAGYHLLLLARDLGGYRNLMKLSSIGFLEGFYYKPRIDLDALEKHSGGLIASSACLAGEIPMLVLQGRTKEAMGVAGRMNEIFGEGNFFLELQDHGIPEQRTVNAALVEIASRLGIDLIATNDCHYLKKEDAFSHEVLLCIQAGKTLDDENRLRFSSDQFYFKTQAEMERLFPDFPDALHNTYRIFEMVDLELELNNPILPNFQVPEGFTLDTYLRQLVLDGARMRFGPRISEEVTARIEYELRVITGMKFSGYFLIVWDFINYARAKGIPVGPGRGSAAGSMVSYCLGITSLNPLDYNLLFERFLNPDRNEMPDMDIDFCADRREEVIDYVKRKYGDDHVSQIITFNKMKAKAVIKDVARVLGIPFAEANEISKLITEDSLKDALLASEDFKRIRSTGERGRMLVDISLTLEGLARSAGKHAAGVVISRDPLTEYVPLYKDARDGSVSSQYDKVTLEAAGLVKMDFLGLKNLSIITRCIEYIEKNHGLKIDLDSIPLDDPATFDLLQKANTRGVFQLESAGMRNILRKLRPTKFEDIIAVNALYRPGPLDAGMVDDFIARKRNPDRVRYEHPLLEPILMETLGVIVYQEQVMLISQVMGGFSLPEADRLRKAMGKKIPEIIKQMEDKFLKGAESKKIPAKVAHSIFEQIEKFGRYGFNKSHSAAYALVSFQTAYLKAHYPLEYMAALLSYQPDNQDEIIKYVGDCRENGITILPPDINHSRKDFTTENGCVRFGFSAIKGIGEKAIESILEARTRKERFATLDDFLEEIDLLAVNKGAMESLIRAGAFDSIHPVRSRLFHSVDLLLESGRRLQEDRASGQGNLFASTPSETKGGLAGELAAMEPWHDNVKLRHEKEVLGVYVSGHPLAKYEREIKTFACTGISALSGGGDTGEFSIVGIVSELKTRISKNGKRFAVAKLEDMEGAIEALFFPDVLSKYEQIVSTEEPVMVKGSVEFEDEKPRKIIVNEVKSLRETRRESIAAIHIRLDPVGVDEEVLSRIKRVVVENRGTCPLFFHIPETRGEEKIVRAHHTYGITPSDSFMNGLVKIVGEDAVRYSTRNC
ncbi:MAG: DNA polymerase III subunit alpha [Spirochaetota bacterium]|nr:DNA polymerase III subunit alpha [Spirochaetota bacterium]OPZ38908.1 MAG: DNA polymerase III subunit alpha [Spirochaetes bacterium ADurb.BinA120]